MDSDQSPAAKSDPGTVPPGVPCPFCDGNDTKLLTPFGGQLSVSQHWCNRCRTGFDYIKWEPRREAPPSPPRSAG
jgi:hypothetical protein